MSGLHDPHYRPKERPLAFSKLPAALRFRFAKARHRITLGITCDRDLIHVSFTGGGMEYWEKRGTAWHLLISGRPDGSDIDSLLRTVA
jgi:hypothetical protein